MSNVKALIHELRETALHPQKAVIKSITVTGKDAIGCFPIYTPEEIIYASGYLPVGMWGGKTEIRHADKYLQSFCCSIMRANVEYGVQGTYNMLKAIVLPTFCDTLKCVCENWKVAVPNIPIIATVYPQNRSIKAGFEYLITEFHRIKKEIESITRTIISDKKIEEAFAIYEEYREVMREFVSLAPKYANIINAKDRHLIIKAAYFMDKKIYTKMIKELNNHLILMPEDFFSGVKMIGTGLLSEPVELLNILVENNISIVADDFAQESRQFRVLTRDEGTAVEKMAYRIIDQKGCTFLYEEQKTKGEMLINMVKDNSAHAVFVCMMKFCDPEEFDYPIIKEELEKAGIPILYIETDMQLDSYEQIRTRIQSFSEMLI